MQLTGHPALIVQRLVQGCKLNLTLMITKYLSATTILMVQHFLYRLEPMFRYLGETVAILRMTARRFLMLQIGAILHQLDIKLLTPPILQPQHIVTHVSILPLCVMRAQVVLGAFVDVMIAVEQHGHLIGYGLKTVTKMMIIEYLILFVESQSI